MRNTFLALGLLAFLSGVTTQAQSTFGSIIGNVKDPSGAAVSAAVVTLVNTGENTTRSTKTNNSGDYEALNLKPGLYDVTVESQGFDISTRGPVTLDARQTARVDFYLKVGTQQQTVTVSSEAGVVASETDAVASSYGSEKLTTLPANFRASTSTTPYPLLSTLPGVQSDSSNDTYLSIQGGQPNQTELSIDGISAQSVRQNRPLIEIFPSVDSLAEIKVQALATPPNTVPPAISPPSARVAPMSCTARRSGITRMPTSIPPRSAPTRSRKRKSTTTRSRPAARFGSPRFTRARIRRSFSSPTKPSPTPAPRLSRIMFPPPS